MDTREPTPKAPTGGSLPSRGSERAEELGRRAGRIVKAAKPKVQRLISRAKPRAEKAGHDALQLARDHEEEVKATVAKLVRGRLPRPLGLVVAALVQTDAKPSQSEPLPRCLKCLAPNPVNARFCNQCGSSFQTS